jgi:alcohol dehydrogenase
MGPFDLNMNFRIIHTLQSAATISSLVAELDVNRVFMVTDPGIQALGLDQPIVKTLREQDITLSLFSQVEPNPTVANVEQGLAQARELKPQLLIALG